MSLPRNESAFDGNGKDVIKIDDHFYGETGGIGRESFIHCGVMAEDANSFYREVLYVEYISKKNV